MGGCLKTSRLNKQAKRVIFMVKKAPAGNDRVLSVSQWQAGALNGLLPGTKNRPHASLGFGIVSFFCVSILLLLFLLLLPQRWFSSQLSLIN